MLKDKRIIKFILRLVAITLFGMLGNSNRPYFVYSLSSEKTLFPSDQQPVSQILSYPNPFDSRSANATIRFNLSEESPVHIFIYDNLGYLVREFTVSGQQGENRVIWNGENSAGEKVALGGYLCLFRLEKSGVIKQSILKIGVIH
ncbi:MAG: FlgD immunoglobulin-like domain containing protein [Elusimicrobiota bacterium]